MLNRVDSKPLVILVDDDAALCTAVKFNLEIEGFEVEICESGESLLMRRLPERACLVIDFNLPGVSGVEALRQLRRRQVDLPAVLITSNPPPMVRADAASYGADVVEKPLLGDALVTAIRAALQA